MIGCWIRMVAYGSLKHSGRLARNIWLEGKTIVHLQKSQERPSHMPRGPAKKTGGGFLNPAMAPARTRSRITTERRMNTTG